MITNRLTQNKSVTQRTYGPDAHTYCLFYSIRYIRNNSTSLPSYRTLSQVRGGSTSADLAVFRQARFDNLYHYGDLILLLYRYVDIDINFNLCVDYRNTDTVDGEVGATFPRASRELPLMDQLRPRFGKRLLPNGKDGEDKDELLCRKFSFVHKRFFKAVRYLQLPINIIAMNPCLSI